MNLECFTIMLYALFCVYNVNGTYGMESYSYLHQRQDLAIHQSGLSMTGAVINTVNHKP